MKYRMLEEGELIKEGDEMYCMDITTSNRKRERWVVILSDSFWVGVRVDNTEDFKIRRPLPNSVDFIRRIK